MPFDSKDERSDGEFDAARVVATENELSLDELIRGRIRVWQPRNGYRVNVDSLWLAHFVGPGPLGRVIDLGAGVGVIGLALAVVDLEARITLAELQPAVAALARKNIVENGFAERMSVVEVDLADERAARAVLPGAGFDRVVSCPPYFPVAAGPKVQDESTAISRHELRLTLVDLARATRRLLAPGGRADFVYPADRLPSLLAACAAESLTPVRLRAIHPRLTDSANRILLETQKGARTGLRIEAPLVLGDERGAYTDEAKAALGERD